MDAQERQDLARHLATLSYSKARSEIRKLDPNAILKYWRNAIGPHHWHTAYALPNLGLKITLVEDHRTDPIRDSNLVRANPVYIEAIVEDDPRASTLITERPQDRSHTV